MRIATSAFAQTPEVTLTRFDCGTPQAPTNMKATVVIQHDARDVSKLPVAPESAK